MEKEVSFYKLFLPLTTKKAVIFIIFIGFIVYFNMLFNGFVWDDQILNYSNIAKFNILTYFGHNSINVAGYYYRPVGILYYSLIRLIFGSGAFFDHFFQLGLQILNTVLIFFLFKKFFNKIISFFLSVLFLIHPIQVESVSYVAAALGPLSFCFGITALLIGTKDKLFLKDYFGMFSLLLFSLLSKETGVYFLILISTYRFIFHQKYQINVIFIQILCFLIYFILRINAIGFSLATNNYIPIINAGLVTKIITIPKILAYYIQSFIFPNNLIVEQMWIVEKISVRDFFIPLIIIIIFLGAIIFGGKSIYKTDKKKFKQLVFWLSWFLIGIIFLLPIVPLYMTVADRYFYFPIVGLLGTIGLWFSSVSKRKNVVSDKIFIFAVLIIILLFSVRTIIRNSNWQSNLTLFSHDEKIQTNYAIEDNLAVALENNKEYKEALIHAKNAVKLLPSDVNLHDLGSIYENIGDKKTAIKYYYLASKVNKYAGKFQHFELIDEKLGRALTLYGDSTYAENFLQTSIKDYPDSDVLQAEYAIALYKNNKKEESIAILKKEYERTKNPVILSLLNVINNGESVKRVLYFLNP